MNDPKKTTEAPTEVIAEILSRLPVKSLLRFKSVSKPWYDLISEPWFVNLQRQRSRRNLNVLHITYEQERHISGHYRTTLTFTSADCERNVSEVFTKTLESCGRYRLLSCVSSYNDLICFKTSVWRTCEHIYLYNPVSHQIFALPGRKMLPDDPHSIPGFGYVSSTREYKVMRLFTDSKLDIKCEILTFCPGRDGSNPCGSWRAISEKFSWRVEIIKQPATVHECFYWLTWGYSYPSGRGLVIISFDLRTEKFGIIPLPSESHNSHVYSDSSNRLIVDDFEGKLFLVEDKSLVLLSLWILEDYEKHIWNRAYDIDFSTIYAQQLNCCRLFRSCRYMENGELLIPCHDSERHLPCLYYLYNAKSHFFRRAPELMQQTNKFDRTSGFYWESMVTL